MIDAPDTKRPQQASVQGQSPTERLRAAAARALAEAEQRRKAGLQVSERPHEIDGPKGAEPVRYGDWDVKGRASDF